MALKQRKANFLNAIGNVDNRLGAAIQICIRAQAYKAMAEEFKIKLKG